jgi:GT2 family glycosyltransferase/nucleoside-diphosphate-sugar epimerase
MCAERSAVVIVKHNAGTVLRDCLRSIAGQAREIVVVDNASHAGALDGVLGKSGAGARVIRLPRNLGFAAACNIGIGACTQEAILFLNPDCIASQDLVARLWETLQSDPGIGIVGGFLQNPDRSEQKGGRRFIPSPGRALAPGIGVEFLARLWPSLFLDFNLNEEPLPPSPVGVEAVSGACMMVRRAALGDAGLFDEGFFLHCEDLDLCLRFRNHGWKVVFDPGAKVVHLKGFCGRSKPVFVEWHKHRGMVRFYKKHFRREYPAVLFPLVFFFVHIRFAVVAILSALGLRDRSAGVPVANGPPQPPAGEGFVPGGGCWEKAPKVGVLGASSFVGSALIPALVAKQCRVLAFSRRERRSTHPAVAWGEFRESAPEPGGAVSSWVSLCPLPVLAGLLPLLSAMGAKRVVAVSSTSRFTKIASGDAAEQKLASDIAGAEESLLRWAAGSGVELVLLRPTLVYDGVGDRNVAAICRFVRRWGWFPVFAPAAGLRQPVHVDDVARACVAALSPSAPPGAYNLSGGETLSYREMVARIFAWEGLPPRILGVPEWLVRSAVPLLGRLPGFRGLSVGVFERMNEDLVFDHGKAAESLGFRPRKFEAPVAAMVPC